MTESQLYTEQWLCARVAEGDETAFRRLFENNWDAVYYVAHGFTKSRVLAEEIVQDVFLKVWINREKLSEVKNFKGYLYILARNHIFNAVKKKIREVPFTAHSIQSLSEPSYAPDVLIQNKEYGQIINKALEKLPDQQRRVYHLSREMGMTQDEIALEMNISKNTVKSHMNKALHSLRDYLQGHAGIDFLLFVFLLTI